MYILKLFSQKRLLMKVISTCMQIVILQLRSRRLCGLAIGINSTGISPLSVRQHLTDRLSMNTVNFVRAVGGPHIGSLLRSVECFEPASLETLWEDDDGKWDVFFDAYHAVRALEDALCMRSHHPYAVPTERTFRTLQALTENMASLLVQSFALDTKYPSSIVHVGLANLTLNLLADSDLDSSILLGFIVELSISLGESPMLVRELERMKKSEPTKEMVLDVITVHATGHLGRLTIIEHEEVVA